ncbi:MAG: cytochrome c biogenesis protein CcsA [Flavobacteriales bacterium Tduv]
MLRIFYLLFSTRLMAVLLLVYALSMAVATFVEQVYSTDTAKALIYQSTWFETVMLLLIISFMGNIGRYHLLKKEKWPLLVFHLAFVLIFVGGAISRYFGFEGMMLIRQGDTAQQIISDRSYIKLQISESDEMMAYHEPYVLSPFHYSYKGKFAFKNQIFQVKVVDYVPYAKETFFEDTQGRKTLKIITTDKSDRAENFLRSGQVKNFGGILVSFDKNVERAVQISERQGKLYITSPFEGDYLVMATQQAGILPKRTLSELHLRTLYRVGGIRFVLPDGVRRGTVKYVPSEKDKKKYADAVTAEISSGGQSQRVTFLGNKGVTGMGGQVLLDGKQVDIGYGSIFLDVPFAIRLNRFELKKYPGSESPSSFASEVTVIDGDREENHRIFMNHVLDYGGYRFFQSGYDPDGNGTRLSVNHDDWGTWISYFGYFLLGVGMFFTLFWKGTRFDKLRQAFGALARRSTFLFILFSSMLSAQHGPEKIKRVSIDSFCTTIKIPKDHAEKFGRLLVQDLQGRVNPIHTMALKLLRKVYKKDHIEGLDATQWMISMTQDGWLVSVRRGSIGWAKVPFVKVGSKGGKDFLELTRADQDGYTSLMELYRADPSTGEVNFVFEREYESSFAKSPAQRDEYDKALINLSERVSIISGMFQGQYLRIFPVLNDPKNTWTSWMTPDLRVNSSAFILLSNYFIAFSHAQQTQDWAPANKALDKIRNYQNLYGHEVIPSANRVEAEILYNRLNVFYRVMLCYLALGSLLLVLAFVKIFAPFRGIGILVKIFIGLLLFFFLYHSFGLVLRWYVSGHAPWSNGYESTVFISWCTILSGFLFYQNRNVFVPAITALSATALLGVAHGNLMDPEVTNLVPVLKSYWLMIHVAVITSSYGFLSTGAFLGLVVLVLYVIKGKSRQALINVSIKELIIINEMTLTVGVFLLAVGTFLGGIWANESWGRYWSWDPKETWAFISIIVYTFVLHMRLVPGLRGAFAFNLAGLLAISSIIMTYFGVNYYLSGLHSYAKGDPVPVPTWIYYTVTAVLSLSVLAYYRTRGTASEK